MRLAAVLLVLLQATSAQAQESPETKLVIQQGTREIGREEFTLTQGRGRGALGTSLRATAKQWRDAPGRDPGTRRAGGAGPSVPSLPSTPRRAGDRSDPRRH